MALISLKDVEIRNFLSYGNYATIVPLAGQEQCFIEGEISDAESDKRRSNGAGKSTLMQSILWCLTGRTMHKANPGNNILNWFTTEDCSVKLNFQTGEELTRVRRRSGETELLLQRNGIDIINSTLSTTPNMQKLINKEFELDWDVFCGSVFCSQFNKPWLEMSDPARKAAFERITGIDRLTVYADVAKAKKGRVEVQQEKLKNQLQVVDSAMTGLTESLENAKSDLTNFEHTKDNKRKSKLKEADGHEEKANLLELVDLDKLKKKWGIIDKVQKKVNDLREQKTGIDSKISKVHNSQAADAEAIRKKRDSDVAVVDKESRTQSKVFARTAKELQNTKNEARDLLATHRAELNPLGQQVERWESKKGEECIECEQPVPDTHVSSKVHDIEVEIELLNNNIVKINNDIDGITTKIKLNEVTQETTLAKYDHQREVIVAEADNQLAELEKSCVQQIKQHKSEQESLKATISSALGKLAENTPKVTVKEAKAQNAHKDQLLDLAASLRKEAGEISLEDNPYQQLIDNLTKQLETKQLARKEYDKKLGDFNVIYQHLHYIQRSYADRRKIKSYLIGQHIPFFNTRLYHYLDAFKLDLKISLTDSLTLDSEKWDYEYFSGGERKCFDVAFMFAVLDLHEEIHGKQCNMLVLDEVDGRLDEAFIDDLINVIKTDLASKFESIFIISHRKTMKDVFPNLLSVRRTDRLSQVFQDYAA